MLYRYPIRDQTNMTTADTEYSFTFPVDTKKFILQERDGLEFKLAFKSGDIALDRYITVHPGIAKVEENLNLSEQLTVYFTCATAGAVMEIEYWK